jgi:hypothetical protein
MTDDIIKKKKIRRKKRQKNEQKPETAKQRAKRKWGPRLTSEQLKARYELMKKQAKDFEKEILRNERTATKNNALRLAELGFSVIPVNISEKKPYIQWKPYQTKRATPEEIFQWWQMWPDAQIGIITGLISNLVVLDFDGADVKERFEAEVCRIPKTIMQKTGRVDGGFHCLFSYPAEGIKCSHGKIFKNVDVKGDGGYFIAAPSKHKSGKYYRWLNWNPFEDGLSGLSELPEEVLKWYQDYEQRKNDPVRDQAKLKPSEILKGVPEGQRNDTLFRYGCRLNYQGLTEEEINILVRQAAISCDPPLPESETISLIKSALKYENRKNGLIDKKKAEIKLYTASELLLMELPEPEWAIPGILPEGLNILGGKPKAGKSILAMNACIAVAQGEKAFDYVTVEKGSAINLALEDPTGRLQRRLREMIPQGKAWHETDNLLIARSWPRMNEGGLNLLQEEIMKRSDIRLVVIDTFVKFRPIPKERSGNPYEIDYEHVSRIKSLADENNISILLIHHLRKMESADVFDTFSGTFGITGAADGLLALIRKKGRPELHITGRDIENADYALELDASKMRWNILGKTEDVQSSIAKQEVYDTLREAEDVLSPTKISEITGFKRIYVQKALGTLVAEGKITKEGRGRYKK